MVFGPIHPKLQTLDTLNTSNTRIRDMMLGKMKDEVPASPILIWADVRDVALAHVRAAERPEAAGKRFFVTAGYFSNRELADEVQKLLPDVKIAPTGGEFPEGTSVHELAKSELTLAAGGTFKYDNSRTREILGIEFRSLKDMLKDTIPTMKAIGA